MLIPLHGIASRHDLPLPFSFVVLGAALALVLSFVVLIFAWREPRFRTVGGRPLPGLTRIIDDPWVRRIARLLVLAVYAWAAMALMLGQDLLTNPIFGFVYVWMWVGLVPISLLLGQFWRATNPLRTVHGGLCALARIDPRQGLLRLPRRVGVWPAAAGPVRLQLARARPAGPHHAGRAAGLGAGLAGDHDHRSGRLRFALDRRGRSVRDLLEHRRPALALAPGR